MAGIDTAGRAIAGLLGYNPGPGIYSRLERAFEGLPANVRVQELPGLLKRYREGVPGWELKATDLDSTIAGRDVVPRDELLAAVRERSPVYTHKETVLTGEPNKYPEDVFGLGELARRYYTPGSIVRSDDGWYDKVLSFHQNAGEPWNWSVSVIRTDPHGNPVAGERPRAHSTWPDQRRAKEFLQAEALRAPRQIGGGTVVASPQYPGYGQGGDNYTELLLSQPSVPQDFFSHWSGVDPEAVAHARFDTHGDALRINELQSDLGIHNRKMRDVKPVPAGTDAESIVAKDRRESDARYMQRMRALGYSVARGDNGGWVIVHSGRVLPFQMEDAWAELLIKRLALEAARKGQNAIEIASPEAIFAKTGNHDDAAESLARMQRYYGDYLPGKIESLGKRLGGLTPEVPRLPADPAYDVWRESEDLLRQYRRFNQGEPDRIDAFNELLDAESPLARREAAARLYEIFDNGDPGYATAMTRDAMALADQTNAARRVRGRLERRGIGPPKVQTEAPGRRYIMSDAMRRNLIEKGVGASLLAPLLMQGEE